MQGVQYGDGRLGLHRLHGAIEHRTRRRGGTCNAFHPNKDQRSFGCWVVLSRWRLQIRWWEKAPGWLQDTAKEVRALSLHGLRLAHRLWVDPSTKDTSISTQKDDAFG